MAGMDPARQIKARFEGIFASLAEPVLWLDLRRDPAEAELQGYLTKGSGPGASDEFRFSAPVAGLLPGAVLRLASGEARWRVQSLHEERMESQLLFVAARVVSLQAGHEEASERAETLIAELQACLERSSLGPLDRDDAAEALARLPRLCAQPADHEHAARLRARLFLLKERFKRCPQTWHPAQGLLLRLEALLKREGLP